MIVAATPVPNYIADSIKEGFYFECGCGEHYNSVAAAASCRKCRSYSVFGWCTHVTDLRNGEVVWGEKPSQEEYEAQLAIAQVEWAEEKAYYDALEQMHREEAEIGMQKEDEEEWEVYETKAEEAGY